MPDTLTPKCRSRSRTAPGTILLAILAVATPWAGPARAAPEDGLAARWTFDATLKARAGDAIELTPRGPQGEPATARFVTAEQLPGTSGQAVALGVAEGDAQWLTAPVSDAVRLGPEYTIELWVHPVQLATWGRLVLRWGGAPRYAYHVAIHEGRASLYHNQSNGEYLFAEGGRLHTGRWHHLAAVARPNAERPAESTLAVYLDGRLAGSARYDGTLHDAADEGLGIGDSAGAPSAGSRFRGYIDEVVLWRRALSDEEIAARYAARAEVLQRLAAAQRKEEADRRARLLAGLEFDGCEAIVFAERGPGRDPGGHYYANFGYASVDPDMWIHGADGGRLLKLNVRNGDLTPLVDDPGGAVRDPVVHYDGRKILFSYRKAGSRHYHLYEVGVDGSGLRQLTSGPFDDIEPAYLPDGDIVFCSSRCNRWIGCFFTQTAVLFRCGPDGDDIQMLSSGAFTENTPAVLPDGRVLYTRWEYVNRDPVSFHHLWTVFPDGSGQTVYFGNMHAGGVFIGARPIPGGEELVLINSPGHGRNEATGHLALLTAKQGPDDRRALRNITRSADFRDPYPLSADRFLVARGNQLLLMDREGGGEVIYTGEQMVHEPRALRPRPREAVLPRRSDVRKDKATLLLADVYTGRNMEGVAPGAIERLLVLEDLPKPVNFHGGGSQPIGHGVTSTLKRILGTVPVEPDGSAHFEVPAMRSIYFAALDASGRSVKQMRSFVTLQPGETLSCVGCHEPRLRTPTFATAMPAAFVREASRIEPIAEVPPVMDFPRDVQPILDRHCVECHRPERREGGVVLSGDRGPVYSLGYYELFLHWQVKDTSGPPGHLSGRPHGNDPPYAAYSSASRLMDVLEPDHHGVQLSPREKKTIRLWIDSGAAYPGTYAALGSGQVGGMWRNNEPTRVMADGWPSTRPAAEAVQRRCGACHSADRFPHHVTARTRIDPWGDLLSWQRPLSRYSRHRIYNLCRPEQSLVLRAPLARDAGGDAEAPPPSPDDLRPVTEDRSRPPRPVRHPVVFHDTSDPDYRAILAHVVAASEKLDEIKRFDMPGFVPNEHYLREMQRYGVLPAAFDPARDPCDVYTIDEAYWRLFWHRPAAADEPDW